MLPHKLETRLFAATFISIIQANLLVAELLQTQIFCQKGKRLENGLTTTGFIRLDMCMKNRTVAVGTNRVKLHCEVSGDPFPQYQWFQNGYRIQTRNVKIKAQLFGSTLTITNVSSKNGGTYTCRAENAHGQLHVSGTITVTGAVSVHDGATVITTQKMRHEMSTASDICRPLPANNLCSSINGASTYHTLSRDTSITNAITESFTRLQLTNEVSRRCFQLLTEMVCLYVYPLCASQHGRSIRRALCKRSCDRYLATPDCPTLPTLASTLPVQIQPRCSGLPTGELCLSRDPSTRSAQPGEPQRSPLDDHMLIVVAMALLVVCSLLVAVLVCLVRRRRSVTAPKDTASGGNTTPASTTVAPANHTGDAAVHTRLVSQKPPPPPPPPLIDNCNNTIAYVTTVCGGSRSSGSDTRLQEFAAGGAATAAVQLSNAIPMYDRSQIRLEKHIGTDRFGKVYIGDLIGVFNKTSISPVYVKTLAKSAHTSHAYRDLLRHANRAHRHQHQNVAELLGVCDTFNACCLLVARSSQIDLYALLQRFTVEPEYSNHSVSGHMLAFADQLHIAVQIAAGMDYLAECEYLHKDLAARNVLIDENLACRISDIGACRPDYAEQYYTSPDGSGLIPLRWMPPEAIFHRCYSPHSDVWSFGVVLWEVWSHGLMPFYGHCDVKAMELIRNAHVLSCPPNCPSAVHALMIDCWHAVPEQRPSFVEMQTRLRLWQAGNNGGLGGSYHQYQPPQSSNGSVNTGSTGVLAAAVEHRPPSQRIAAVPMIDTVLNVSQSDSHSPLIYTSNPGISLA